MTTDHFVLNPPPEYQTFSGEEFTLRLESELLPILDEFARTPQQRGSETAGLLFGSDCSDFRNGAQQVITIEDLFGPAFELFGPAYQLSPPDIELARQAIAEVRQDGESRVIGHFRSSTEGGPDVTNADQHFAALIGAQQPLMLLIGSSGDEPGLGRLYRNDGGKFVEVAEFALGPERIESSPVAPVSLTPALSLVSVRSLTSSTSSWRLGWKRLLGAAALLACAALVSFFMWRTPSSNASEELGLSVQRKETHLVVSWDHSSRTVQNAVSGVLTIQDGPSQRKFPLTTSELRSDSISYTPETANIEFRLEVYRDNLHHTDSKVVVLDVPSSRRPELAIQGKQPNPSIAGVTREQANRPAEDRPAPPRVTKVQTPEKSDVPTKAAELALRVAEKKPEVFHAPPAGEPPAVLIPPATPNSTPILVAPSLEVAAPPVAPSAIPPPVINRLAVAPPATPSAIPPVASKLAAAPPVDNYAAPIPIRKILPTVPSNFRAYIPEGVLIQVKVTVNAKGEVVSAIPVNVSGSRERLLTPTALQAAMLWRFEPARRDGQPVVSEAILKFNFQR